MSLPDDNEEIQPQDPRKEQEEVDQDTERALFLKAFAEDTTKSYLVSFTLMLLYFALSKYRC